MSSSRRQGSISQPENYFMSMTDMMIGMLFVFIIMLMAFALNLKEAEQEKEQAIEQLTKAQLARTEFLQTLKNKLDESLKREGVTVEIDVRNGWLRLPEEILFASGRATMNASGIRSVEILAEHLASEIPCYLPVEENPQVECDKRSPAFFESVFIEGHTDNMALGSRLSAKFGDNWGLSADRSIYVYKRLIESQPILEVLKNTAGQPIFSATGYGDSRPTAPESNETEVGRKTNRRIDLRFVMQTPHSEDILDKPSNIEDNNGAI